MIRVRLAVSCLAVPLLLAGCGEGGSGRDTEADTGVQTDTGIESDGGNDGANDGGNDGANDAGSEGETSVGDSGEDGGDEGGGVGPRFDVLAVPDAPPCGGEGGGDVTHSYIWIANSSQGTVSKINTQTVVEEGRYRVRPDSSGNPSRTSVGLSGDVVVANRAGGIVKLWANPETCQETNGMPGIQTSGGGNDLLAWGVEECVAWYTDFPNYSTQRPVTWAQGEFNNKTCAYENEKVWTAGGSGAGTHYVSLLDGDTGMVEETVDIPNVIGWAGLYGGSVDGEGNFYTVDHNWSGPSTLIRVNRDDFSYEEWEVTGQVHYGLAVDSKGRAWLCGSGGASRFDPETETWTHLNPQNGGSALGGCMTDGEGTLWTSPYPTAALVAIDTETVQQIDSINIPSYVHGVSIDFEGNVWGVEFGGDQAFRVDPETKMYDTFTGLQGAYTYSDMTGFALSAAGTPNG